MKRFLYTAFILLSVGYALAAETPWYNPDAAVYPMSGTVVDENGKPVSNISIFECGAGASRTAKTDENGKFTFPRGQRGDKILAANADRSLLGIWRETTPKTYQPNTDTTIILKPARTITGTVKDTVGQPVPDTLIIATADHQEIVQTQTNADGEFSLQYPADIPLAAILALKPGAGFDYIWTLETPASNEYRTFGIEGNPAARKKSDGPFALTLEGVNPVRFRCVDDTGKPIQGVEIRPWYFTNHHQPSDLNVWISQYKRISDADGNIVFDFFPTWQKDSITFWASGNGFLRQRVGLSPEHFERENTVRMRRAVALRGTLRFPDGTPAQQWTVRAQGDSGSSDGFVEYTRTDNQGRYEVMAIPNQIVHLNAEAPDGITVQPIDKDWVAVPKLNIAVGDEPILVQDFTLEKGTRVAGVATAGEEKEPVANTSIIIHCQTENDDAAEGESPFKNISSWWWERTDTNGAFEFWIAPGHYEMQLQHGNYAKEPVAQITVERDAGQTVNFHADKPAMRTAKKIRGKAFFDNDPDKIAAGASVSYRSYDLQMADLKTDEKGEFEITAKEDPVYVQVMTPEGLFGKMVIVPPDVKEFTVSLEMTATIRGRLIDRQSGEPAAGRTVMYAVNLPGPQGGFTPFFQRDAKTDETGAYELSHLPVGVPCNVTLPRYNYGEERAYSNAYIGGGNLNLEPATYRVLSDYTCDSRPNGREEYSFQVYNFNFGTTVLSGGNPFEKRFDILQERAKRDGKGVFAIVVRDTLEENVEPLSELYETLFRDDDVFAQTERFYMMCVTMRPKEDRWTRISTADAQEFVRVHNIAEPLPALFSFVFFDADGSVRDVEAFDHTVSLAKQKETLIGMLKRY